MNQTSSHNIPEPSSAFVVPAHCIGSAPSSLQKRFLSLHIHERRSSSILSSGQTFLSADFCSSRGLPAQQMGPFVSFFFFYVQPQCDICSPLLLDKCLASRNRRGARCTQHLSGEGLRVTVILVLKKVLLPLLKMSFPWQLFP